MKVTSKSLAAQLGLAQATVSMALANHPNIALKTRQRVKEAATRLNYSPNRVARAMRTNRTHLLGILVPSVRISFFPDIVEAMEIEADRHDYRCLLCQFRSTEEAFVKQINLLEEHCVDGLVVFPVNSFAGREILTRLESRNLPVVFCDGLVEGIQAPSVHTDNVAAGRLATEHLIKLGHRRIVYLKGYWDSFNARERFEGYCAALAAHQIPLIESLTDTAGAWELAAGRSGIETLLDRGEAFTGVVAASDMQAVGALQALRERGRRVPEEVSVVGCANLDFAEFVTPSLTTVDQKPAELGRRALAVLMERIKGKPAVRLTELIKPELVHRESTRQV